MNILGAFAAVLGVFGLSVASSANASAPPIDYTPADPEDDPLTTPTQPVIDYTPTGGDPDVNMTAFLAALRTGESADDYGALVGGGTTSDLSHHPGFTDASMRTRSSWAGWAGHNTHAAGAYQFQPGTFKTISDRIGLAGRFDPDAQDAAAIEDIRGRGALTAVRSGNLQLAFTLLRPEWESLPVRGYPWVLSQYETNGGTVS